LLYLYEIGGLGDVQLNWLKDQLKYCSESNIKAIVCGHLPVHAQSSDTNCLAWVRNN
jgi:hypothetical protein